MKWISIKDHQPKDGQKILVRSIDRITDAEWSGLPGSGVCFPFCYCCEGTFDPTHWMPFPEDIDEEI